MKLMEDEPAQSFRVNELEKDIGNETGLDEMFIDAGPEVFKVWLRFGFMLRSDLQDYMTLGHRDWEIQGCRGLP